MIVPIHIPKNGGSTFDEILKPHFGTEFVALYLEGKPGYFLTEAELAEFISRHRDAQAVAGHEICYPCPALPGLHYDYVTFLRHPVERIVSLYYHERRVFAPKDPHHRANLSLEAYLNLLIEQHPLARWQCCHLHRTCDLTQAQEVLRRFTLVGLVERYDDSLALAARRLGLPLGAMVTPPRNVSKQATARDRSGADLYKRVARACGADIDLFHYGCDLLEAEWRRMNRWFPLQVGWLKYANWSVRRPPARDIVRGKLQGRGRRARRLVGAGRSAQA